MGVEKHKNTVKWYKQDLFDSLKYGSNGAKHTLKSVVLGAKSGDLGMKIYEPATKLERQNGAKCRQHV